MFFEYSLKNFQGFMLLFSYQCPFCRFVRQLIYFITLFSSCQELFYFSFQLDVFQSDVLFSQQMIYYHVFRCLSTTFFICFLSPSVGSLLPVAATLINLSQFPSDVNRVFQLFYYLWKTPIISLFPDKKWYNMNKSTLGEIIWSSLII